MQSQEEQKTFLMKLKCASINPQYEPSAVHGPTSDFLGGMNNGPFLTGTIVDW